MFKNLFGLNVPKTRSFGDVLHKQNLFFFFGTLFNLQLIASVNMIYHDLMFMLAQKLLRNVKKSNRLSGFLFLLPSYNLASSEFGYISLIFYDRVVMLMRAEKDIFKNCFFFSKLYTVYAKETYLNFLRNLKLPKDIFHTSFRA